MKRTSIAQQIWLFGSFLRLPLFGWCLAMLTLGILSVRSGLGPDAIAVAAVAIPFQIVFAVVNDLATIDMDRLDSRKAGRPLVSGAVKPWAAKTLVVIAVAVAFPVDAALLGFDLARVAALTVAFAATAIYNIAGKRSPFPPLMDFLLGIGSAALVQYSALAVGSPTGVTYLVECAVVLYITLDNGVHFSVRDIDSDLQYSARTTAILFGVRPTGAAPYLPRRFLIYALGLQAALTVNTLVPVLIAAFGGSSPWSSLVVAVIFAFGTYITVYPAINASVSNRVRYASGYAQSLCAFGSIASLGATRYGGLAALCVFAITGVPLGLKSATRLVGKAVRLASRAPDSGLTTSSSAGEHVAEDNL
jgi:4-hydroxybenzoate polyprenyltransferase